MAVGRAAGGIRVADTMRRPQEARTLRTCNRPDGPAEVCDLGLTCRGCKPCTDRSLGERGLIQMSALARLATQVELTQGPRSAKCRRFQFCQRIGSAGVALTSSAVASSVGGTSSPSALAVLRL